MRGIRQIEWRPMCETHGGELLLGPNPHPCRDCGTPTQTALRVVR